MLLRIHVHIHCSMCTIHIHVHEHVSMYMLKNIHCIHVILLQHRKHLPLLGRLLPVMVGDLIPEDDKNWEHYLTTIEIANYMLAPEIHRDEVAYLGTILPEHHKTFAELYPGLYTQGYL